MIDSSHTNRRYTIDCGDGFGCVSADVIEQNWIASGTLVVFVVFFIQHQTAIKFEIYFARTLCIQ